MVHSNLFTAVVDYQVIQRLAVLLGVRFGLYRFDGHLGQVRFI